MIWGKRRIMEVYLNSIEMGDGIYGAEAVAQLHFSRSALHLTRPNCDLIAATLPNPIKFSSRNPSPYMLKRQTAIMKQMRHIDSFSGFDPHPQFIPVIVSRSLSAVRSAVSQNDVQVRINNS